MEVDLAWHPGTADAAQALARHVRGLLGPGRVESGRLCPACGSSRHGRPWARHEAVDVPVSLSRSGPHLVTAVGVGVSPGGSVGVDVESPATVEDRWDPSLVLAPGEVAATAVDRALAWTRKEAALKAYGVGLLHPMERLPLRGLACELYDVAAPAGHVAAVAVVGADALRAGPAAPPGRATRRTAR